MGGLVADVNHQRGIISRTGKYRLFSHYRHPLGGSSAMVLLTRITIHPRCGSCNLVYRASGPLVMQVLVLAVQNDATRADVRRGDLRGHAVSIGIVGSIGVALFERCLRMW